MPDLPLSEQQRKLWRRAERRGGLASMSVAELDDWLRACDLMERNSDAHGASKARRLWNTRRREVEAELTHRGDSR